MHFMESVHAHHSGYLEWTRTHTFECCVFVLECVSAPVECLCENYDNLQPRFGFMIRLN